MKFSSSLSHRAGFTLIELLVSISIIAIMTVIGTVSYIQTTKNARDARRRTDLETVRQAMVLYKTDKNGYPLPSGATAYDKFNSLLSTLSTGKYLSNSAAIIDPKDGQASGDSPLTKYGYLYASGDVSSFSICAELESMTSYCVANP